MASYPPLPGHPEGMPTPMHRPAPPPSVQSAVKLMYAGAAFSALGLLLGLGARSTIRAAVLQAQPKASIATINADVSAYVAAAIAAGIIGVGLWIWMAFANGRGRSWARVTGTVFFGFDCLGIVVSLTQAAPGASKLIGGLVWLAGLGAVIYLWKPDSSAYFHGPPPGTFG
jgi:hypothetical protein